MGTFEFGEFLNKAAGFVFFSREKVNISLLMGL
jgi:hypothetical protein